MTGIRRGWPELVAGLALIWRVRRPARGQPEGSGYMLNAFGAWIETLGLLAAAYSLLRRDHPVGSAGLAAGALLAGARAAHWQPRDRIAPRQERTRAASPTRRPRPTSPTDRPGALRLLTANLLYLQSGPDALLELVNVTQPDLVLLQELNPDTAEALDAAAPLPCQHLDPRDDADGFGLLSRYPIEDVRFHQLQVGNRFLQTARVTAPEGEIYVLNCHLVSPVDMDALADISTTGLPDRTDGPVEALAKLAAQSPAGLTSLRETQAQMVADLVAAGEGATIIAGDLNASPGQAPHVRLADVAEDCWPAAGEGFGVTWPVRPPSSLAGLAPLVPLLRLDHVFVTPPLRPTRLEVWRHPGLGSDHAPQVADLVWLPVG